MDQNTLEFQEAKLDRLLIAQTEIKYAFEHDRLGRAIAKCRRRIDRLSTPKKEQPKEGSLKEFMERDGKLTQEEKAQKKRDYQRQRKDRYKGKGK